MNYSLYGGGKTILQLYNSLGNKIYTKLLEYNPNTNNDKQLEIDNVLQQFLQIDPTADLNTQKNTTVGGMDYY